MAGVPIAQPNVLVIVTGSILDSGWLFLDMIKVRHDATYLIASGLQVDDLHTRVSGAKVLPLKVFMEREETTSADMIFIPECDNAGIEASEADIGELHTHIRHLFGDGRVIVAVGTARLLLAVSGLMRERVGSGASLDRANEYSGMVSRWVQEPIVRDWCIWTASGAIKIVRSLAYLYRASRKGDLKSSNFPLRIFTSHTRDAGASDPKDNTVAKIPTPVGLGEAIAKEIASYVPSLAESAQQMVVDLAIRLGVEGSVHACNDLIVTLLTIFPNTFDSIAAESILSLEHIWFISGDRPNFPWEPQFGEDRAESETYKRKRFGFPAEEDRDDILHSIEVRIAYDTFNDSFVPYTLAGAIAMALDAGKKDKAVEWLTILVHLCMEAASLTIWRELVLWRNVAELALTGGTVAQIVGRPAEEIQQDALSVKTALLSFPETSASALAARHAARAKFVRAPMSALVPMLEVLKLETYDTLLRPPATPTAIQEAEKRLEIQLPSDYKEFLLVSNGVEFMIPVDAQGFRRIEDVKWQDAVELGFHEFPVTLGCDVDPDEYARLPKMTRVLIISDEASEEMLFYVDEETVTEAINFLKAEGRSAEVVGKPTMRAVHWVHWVPEETWLRSFREYVEDLAMQAEGYGAVLE